MAFSFDDLTPEGKRYFAELMKLCSFEVRVGFQAKENDYKDGTALVDVAAFNEFGTSEIPARPFMKQSFDNHEDKLRSTGRKINNMLANGDSAEKAFKTVGVAAKGLVQKEIRDGVFEPNTPATIRSKGSDRPLIDTGHMRQSVNYVIKRKGE